MLYDIKITLKSHFWGKKVIIASLLRPYDFQKSVNYWCYFTPRRDVVNKKKC